MDDEIAIVFITKYKMTRFLSQSERTTHHENILAQLGRNACFIDVQSNLIFCCFMFLMTRNIYKKSKWEYLTRENQESLAQINNYF